MQIKGGFKESALRLNSYVVEQTRWGEDQIVERGKRLAELALKIWTFPDMTAEEFAPYKPQEKVQYSMASYAWNLVNKMLFEKLDEQIMALSPEVRREYTKLYIAYKYDTNFVDVVVQKDGLKLMVNMDYSEIDDPQNLCKDFTDTGAWGNGNAGLFFDSLGNLDAVMYIIKQSFENQMDTP